MYHYLTNKAKDHLQIRKEFYLVEMYTLNEFTLTCTYDKWYTCSVTCIY